MTPTQFDCDQTHSFAKCVNEWGTQRCLGHPPSESIGCQVCLAHLDVTYFTDKFRAFISHFIVAPASASPKSNPRRSAHPLRRARRPLLAMAWLAIPQVWAVRSEIMVLSSGAFCSATTDLDHGPFPSVKEVLYAAQVQS